ncbi:MAG: hypothetical protein BroJett011_04090 [Chloroflexota bacterium]|nr:MAG: hypothetical protein BroJett011_04090 [Chloroflexota bacterium]
MAAIATSADGGYVFLALENESGQPIIVKASRDDLSAFSPAYNPAAGTAGNVASVQANADQMLFYGNFGSGVQVVLHTVSTGANTNISPGGLTTLVANCLAVNPSDPDEIWITVNNGASSSLRRTLDAGATWEIMAALGFEPTALAITWQSDYSLDRVVVAGHTTTTELRYSPNEGAALADYAGAGLGAAANIVGVQMIP